MFDILAQGKGLKRAVLGAALAVAMPLAAQAQGAGLFDSLLRGAWTLRIRDDGSQQRLCVRDGNELIQIRHRQSGCSRFVVKDTAEEAIVQYTCPGNGYGRTTLRRESSGLVQVQSQGIIDGMPFAFSGEARHSGEC